tara:strand:+ start:80 stop:373 length:294 start_codon:yes stop_codon:yes gene_type:complete
MGKIKALEYFEKGKFLAFLSNDQQFSLECNPHINYDERKMKGILENAGFKIYLACIDNISGIENKGYQQVFLTDKKKWYKEIIWKGQHVVMAKKENV